MKLIFLVPKKVPLRTLSSRVQQMLSLKRAPRFRSCRADGSSPGDRLDENRPVGELFETVAGSADSFLHTLLDIRP